MVKEMSIKAGPSEGRRDWIVPEDPRERSVILAEVVNFSNDCFRTVFEDIAERPPERKRKKPPGQPGNSKLDSREVHSAEDHSGMN
jgi:hypothetical protein